ncbi:MAG: hypothetical protein WBQ44_11565 [Rhodococcus sp. (in: high G+C Gram-positive bacteria)]
MNTLGPGAVVAGGYRLREQHRSVGWAQWWSATDLITDHDVSLSIVRIDMVHAKGMSVAQFCESAGAACRILDVVEWSGYVLVVTESVPGTTLVDAAPTAPAAAARAVRHLATITRDAHRRGQTVALDHPTRVRITDDGVPVLAFPAIGFGTSQARDIAGLGAVLYTLLVGDWPRGVRPAPGGPLGTVADRAGSGAITTVDQLITELDDALTTPETVNRLIGTPRAATATVTAAAALVLGFGAAGWFVTTEAFGGDSAEVEKVVAVPDLPTASAPLVPVGTPVVPTRASVWSAVRAPDNAERAALVVDADPSTTWSTDLYRDPFGRTDNGIGIVVSFTEPTDIGTVRVEAPRAGTTVEIRTPPDAAGTLASTRVLGSAVLGLGATDIPVDAPAGLTDVLIWVAELGPSGTQFGADLAEVGFVRR